MKLELCQLRLSNGQRVDLFPPVACYGEDGGRQYSEGQPFITGGLRLAYIDAILIW
jgi:hypothetical protein